MKKKKKSFIGAYKPEEIDLMNYILGKPSNNRIFTEFELEAMNKIDLFNRKIVNICKIVWEEEMKVGVSECI